MGGQSCKLQSYNLKVRLKRESLLFASASKTYVDDVSGCSMILCHYWRAFAKGGAVEMKQL